MRPGPGARSAASPRRELALVVLLAAAGAGLALVALRQTWVVEVTVRPAPFPAERVTRTGGDLRPWLPALGWAALAGAGALLATRSRLRRAVGGVLLVVGVGLAAGTVTALAGPEAGGWWPAVAVVGGVAAGAAGGLAALRGGRWPALGARYDRAATRAREPRPEGQGERQPDRKRRPDRERGPGRERGPDRERRPDRAATESWWDRLDRGDDPTV